MPLMDHQMRHRFAALTTAHVADACIRARVPVRCASAVCVLWCRGQIHPGLYLQLLQGVQVDLRRRHRPVAQADPTQFDGSSNTR
jgi:hypothetical protein